MTKSELNTIRFFNEIGVSSIRIPECDERTPDFYIKTNKQHIYIEVKEVRDNEAEKELLQEINQNGQTKVHDSPKLGKRFRSLIQRANKQLRNKCKSNDAGLVIIQDVRDFLTRSCTPQEEIKLAMFGDRVTWVSVNSGNIKADVFDKNKTTTEQKNTTISAVGLMLENIQDGNLTLYIYHNPHAKNPLLSPVFQSSKVYEYKIGNIKSYSEFEEC